MNEGNLNISVERKKLTDWVQEPTLENLMHDVKQAEPFHSEQCSKITKWLDGFNAQSDPARVKKGRSGIAPKVIRRLAEWRNASLTTSLLNEQNLFTVHATSPQYLEAAVQNELVLNFQFNHLIDKVKFVNDYVRTAVSEGTVIVRVGWDEQTQFKEYEKSVYNYVQADAAFAQYMMQIVDGIVQESQQTGNNTVEDSQLFQALDPDLQESVIATRKYGYPVQAFPTGEVQIVKEEIQIKNRPSVEVINSKQLIIDPTCKGDFSKAKFAVYRYETSFSQLMQSGLYTKRELEDLLKADLESDLMNAETLATLPDSIFEDTSDTKLRDLLNNFKFQDNPRKRLTAYEYWGYWDIDGTGVVQGFVATIVNNKLIRLARNPYPDNALPFVVVPYLPVKGSVYGEPDGELISDNQEVIKALMRSMIDINARGANGQTAIPKGFLDYTNAKKFREGEDYEYNPLGMHPAEAIFMHTANELPQSVMALVQAQYAEAESATGVKAFQNGIDGNAYGQVVAGMSQAITAMTQRESDIVFRLGKGLQEIGNKVLAMNSMFLNEEEVIAITANEFIPIRREDLTGDFFLAVKIKSNSESEGKAQQLTFIAQTLGQDADWGLRKIFLTEVCRLYNLETMLGQIQNYEPQPDPLQVKQQELEIALLEAQLQKENAEAEYFASRSRFIDAQIGNVQADTDLKNLDYIEQEQGVKHARQREIVQAQAYAQNKGKIATEVLKGQNAKEKALLDNASKERIARSKGNPSKTTSNGKKPQNKAKILQKQRNTGHPKINYGQLPNPEKGALPAGLFKVNGLGNYIRGDGLTVNNQI